MALPFIPSDAGLLALQAGVVAAPRKVGPIRQLQRLRGPGWAIIPVASIVGVIYAIRYASGTATWLTYLALVAVPILAAIALGWLSWGSSPPLAIVAVGLFVLVWRSPHSLAGEAAEAILSGLSCVTLGVLLAAVTPHGWLKAGIIAMSCADVWLVASDLLQHPNSVLSAAAPGAGLPQLQSERFGSVTLGYGDLFVAGLLGAIYAGDRRLQLTAALLTFLFACAFDLLFFVVNELPATVPVALATIALQVGVLRRVVVRSSSP
ncbi:MAG: hypothetical protein ACLP01_22435 [Solirubrobacteraceae bacterium]